MVKYCAAYNCSSSDTTLNCKQGITFHRVPKDNRRKLEWVQALCHVDPMSGSLWTPSVWDMICSQHFNPECFREINKKFFKEGSCPSVFSFPHDCKILSNSLQDSLENISETEVERCSFPPEKPIAECNAKDRLMTEHYYHITDIPKTSKKLDELLMENDKLRRRLRNTSLEEQILHKNVDVLPDSKCSKPMLRETT